MRFATVREISQTPSKFIDLPDPIIITKHGRPVRAMVTLDEEGLEDFILAQSLGLDRDAARASTLSRKGHNIPSSRLRSYFRKQRSR